MKASLRLIWLLALTAGSAHGAEGNRFVLRAATVDIAKQATDGRFAVTASAEIRRRPADSPRFVLKSVLAGCAPLSDALFMNGFK